MYPVYNGSSVAAGDAVTTKFAGVEKSFYTSTGYLVGLARQATSNSTSGTMVCCPVAEDGIELPFTSGAEGTVTAQAPMKMSQATSGAFQTARSISDEAVGFCTTTGKMRLFRSAKNTPRVTKWYRNARSDASASTYTALASDNNQTIRFTTGSAVALTLPATFPVGYTVRFVQGGAGAITWSAGSGATINTAFGSVVKTNGVGAWFDAVVESNNSGLTAGVWNIQGTGLST
jgi:hypothetical protein